MRKGSQLLIALSTISTVMAADIYREDFNDNASNPTLWTDAPGLGGSFNENNEHLEYVVPAASGATDEARRAFSIPVPLNKDWTVTMLTSFDLVPALGENIGIGIAFHHATDLNRRLYILQYSEGTTTGARQFRGFQSRFHNAAARRSSNYLLMQKPAAVRLAYNSKSRLVFVSFDPDGPLNDLIWEQHHVYGIAGSGGYSNQNWNLTEADPLRVSIQAFSNSMTINPGAVTADDFKLSILTEDHLRLNIRPLLDSDAVELTWPAAGACFNIWMGPLDGPTWNWIANEPIERDDDMLHFRVPLGFSQLWLQLGRLKP